MPNTIKAETYNITDKNAVKIAIGEFDHATSAHGNQKISSKQKKTHSLTQELRPRLQAFLQTTLDLEEQLAIFCSEIGDSITFDSVSYINERENIEINQGHESDHKISFNLMTQGDRVGALKFSRKKKFARQELQLLEEASTTLIYPVRNALRYREALQSALTDALTQVGNRLALESTLHKEIEVSHRYNRALSILLIDIDRFKSVNDQYGHAAGDTVLKNISASLADTCRQADSTYRYGGEEFVVLLTNTSNAGALTIAERLRATIAGLTCIHEQLEIPVTISIGVATLKPTEMRQEILERADQALYQAKHLGRNRVVNSNAPEKKAL